MPVSHTRAGVLDFFHYPSPDSEPYHRQIEDWIAQLDPERDQGERSYGPRSSRAWFYRNNFDIEPDSHLGTHFGVDRESRLVVVMATLVVDDRGIRKKYDVPGEKMWGFVMTHHDHRRKGHGTAICTYIDQRTQSRVNDTGIAETDALFTAYPPAVTIYKRLGFQFVHKVVIDDPGLTGGGDPITEDLYLKDYTPKR